MEGMTRMTRASSRHRNWLVRKRAGPAVVSPAGRLRGAWLLLRGVERRRRVQHAAAKAPFIVIPAGDFYHAACDLGQRCVEDARARIMVEFARDQRLGVVAENALELVL